VRTLRNLLRGTGRRRCADYIPVVEAERDQAVAEVAALKERLGHADDLLVAVCCRNARLEAALREARTDRDLVADAHLMLLTEHDELTHRLIEARAEIANLRAISSPAPVDHGPAIQLPEAPDAPTEELFVGPLWDTRNLHTAA